VLDQRLLEYVDVFTPAQCAEIHARLESMRDHWLARQPGFATIGVATYLDVSCSANAEETYYARLAAQNALLRSHFADELEHIRGVMARVLGRPTRFDDAVALPGFHVFEGLGVATIERPNAHFDHQHRYLRWPFEISSPRVISFTIAIKLPTLGGGLDTWQVTEDEIVRLRRMGRDDTLEHLVKVKPVVKYPYQVGRALVQLVTVAHRISTVRERRHGDQRITIQGHGVRDGDTWVLYW